MEIHAPHHPIMSLKEFLVHLLTVTVGILIALGLEQSVEAYHHSHLAQEARENMLTEIRDNKAELDKRLGNLDKLLQDRDHAIKLTDRLLAHQPLGRAEVVLDFSNATLNSASWSTASTVGALAYMDYSEVKRFAEVYKLQDLFERIQNEQIQHVQAGGALLKNFDEKASSDELHALKRELQQSVVSLQVLGQLGKTLSDQYAKTLAKKEGLEYSHFRMRCE